VLSKSAKTQVLSQLSSQWYYRVPSPYL